MRAPERGSSKSGTLSTPRATNTLKSLPMYQQASTYYKTSTPTWAQLSSMARGTAQANAEASRARVGLSNTGGGGSGGGGGRGYGGGGGGGGGAKPDPQYSQAQLDWMANLLKAGGPKGTQISPFNDARYKQLNAALGQAVATDRASAATANQNYTNYLRSNFRNAYAAGPPQTATPGMSQEAMQRMLQAQGADPSVMAANAQGMAGANQAFANIWGLLGAGENQAQQNRLTSAQQDLGWANRALDVAKLQGETGIGQQREQAREAWQQRYDDRALVNQQAAQEYRNATIQALLGLLPDLRGTALNLPGAAALGWV